MPLPRDAVVWLIPAGRSKSPLGGSEPLGAWHGECLHRGTPTAPGKGVPPPVCGRQLGALPAWHGPRFNKLSIYFSRMTPSPPHQ